MKRPSDSRTLKTPDVAQLQLRSQRVFRALLKSAKSTWKLYKGSKTGLAGLAIVVAFLFMATFADLISPYTSDFTAPAEDIFVADNVALELGNDFNWSAPMGLTEATLERALERVMVYSRQGTTLVWPVTSGFRPGATNVGIVPSEMQVYNLPPNALYVNYAHFTTSFFFVLENKTLHEYGYNFIHTNVEHTLPFVPKYHSNLWNGYSTVLPSARLALVFANDTSIWLIDKRPPTPIDPYVRTYKTTVNLTDARVVGNPLVVDVDFFANGNMVIVPTDMGLRAYRINVTKGAITGYVSNVRLGNMMWHTDYGVDGEPFEPVISDSMITFPNPRGVTEEFGKTHVLLATTDGRIVSFARANGTVEWARPLVMPAIRDFEISSLHPSPRAVLVVGTSGEKGFVAGIEPETGSVGYSRTQYGLVEGNLNTPPQYVPGLNMFVFSTDADRIYLVSELMKVNATFSTPGGGSLTPVSFLGNIILESSVTGNYFGVITAENSLFLETLSGVNVAPLAPGTYVSGNRYWLGTDYEGHDVLSWVIYGTRAELLVGVTAAFFSVVIGTIVGLAAGFYSGRIDDILMRSTDVVLSLPYLVIMLLFAAIFGPSLMNIIIIIAVLSWAGIARVIRSVTLSIKERSFVDAAIVAGASQSRLIFKHIAPNVLPYTFLYMTFGISGAIVTEAILAFLGFGDVNYVTWGMMLQYLQISGHALDAWWWLLPPGICITLLSLSFYLIGRAFDEVVNPRLRKR